MTRAQMSKDRESGMNVQMRVDDKSLGRIFCQAGSTELKNVNPFDHKVAPNCQGRLRKNLNFESDGMCPALGVPDAAKNG